MSNDKLIAKNPTAFHNYNIENKLETGIVLSGTEIKSIRNGKANLKDSYAIIKNNEVYLVDQNASSRPSQNVIKALEQMAKAVYPEHYEK